MSNKLKGETHEKVKIEWEWEEWEALKAIYLEDISIEIKEKFNPFLASILVDIYPKTGDNVDDQFVRLTLVVDIPKEYPNVSPIFDFKNVRGLTDDKIEESEMNNILEEKSGETLIYDLIEKLRDLLTALNFPEGNRCPICLYQLTAKDDVVRNECFHHLHCRCFADYMIATKNNSFDSNQKSIENESEILIQCPVCRIQLKITNWKKYCDPNQYSVPYLSNEPLEDESIIIEEAKLNQKKFETIYEKQLKNGGIIYTESQRNKFVLRISETNDQMILS